MRFLYAADKVETDRCVWYSQKTQAYSAKQAAVQLKIRGFKLHNEAARVGHFARLKTVDGVHVSEPRLLGTATPSKVRGTASSVPQTNLFGEVVHSVRR